MGLARPGFSQVIDFHCVNGRICYSQTAYGDLGKGLAKG